MSFEKIAFGGSCHWCTEAIFQSLKGVQKVEQGWLASEGDNNSFSEGVIVHFQAETIELATLVAVHLHSHSCTSRHSMRSKYRSAVYTFSEEQSRVAKEAIASLQAGFKDKIITQILPFKEFNLNKEQYLDYYKKNPDKPFCKAYIEPKLKLILAKFDKFI